MSLHEFAIYSSYTATLLSLAGGGLMLMAPSVLPAEYLDQYPNGKRGLRSNGRIAALLVGGSLFPLLNGAPEAFLTLGCCYLASAIERAITQIPEREFTRFFLIGMAVDLGFAFFVSLPYLPIMAR
jgi:hypothetical protein